MQRHKTMQKWEQICKIEHNVPQLYNIKADIKYSACLFALRNVQKQLTFLISLFIVHTFKLCLFIYINFTSAVACFPMFGHNRPLEAPGSQTPLVTHPVHNRPCSELCQGLLYQCTVCKCITAEIFFNILWMIMKASIGIKLALAS